MFTGFCRALADQNIAWNDKKMIHHLYSDNRETVFREAYQAALNLKQIPPALFVTNDEVAIGLIKGFRERGIRVHEDCAIVAFNTAKPVEFFEDELTAVHHPIFEKAENALSILMNILDGKRSRDEVHTKIIKPHLEIRKTCGSPLCGQRLM